MVIARRGIVGAEGPRRCVTGDCGGGTLLCPGGRVACSRSTLVGQTVTTYSAGQYTGGLLVTTAEIRIMEPEGTAPSRERRVNTLLWNPGSTLVCHTAFETVHGADQLQTTEKLRVSCVPPPPRGSH